MLDIPLSSGVAGRRNPHVVERLTADLQDTVVVPVDRGSGEAMHSRGEGFLCSRPGSPHSPCVTDRTEHAVFVHRSFLTHHVLDQTPECTTRLRLIHFMVVRTALTSAGRYGTVHDGGASRSTLSW
jgi:hypothetical protein